MHVCRTLLCEEHGSVHSAGSAGPQKVGPSLHEDEETFLPSCYAADAEYDWWSAQPMRSLHRCTSEDTLETQTRDGVGGGQITARTNICINTIRVSVLPGFYRTNRPIRSALNIDSCGVLKGGHLYWGHILNFSCRFCWKQLEMNWNPDCDDVLRAFWVQLHKVLSQHTHPAFKAGCRLSSTINRSHSWRSVAIDHMQLQGRCWGRMQPRDTAGQRGARWVGQGHQRYLLVSAGGPVRLDPLSEAETHLFLLEGSFPLTETGQCGTVSPARTRQVHGFCCSASHLDCLVLICILSLCCSATYRCTNQPKRLTHKELKSAHLARLLYNM